MNGWTTLQLRATTPIFNNGATSDTGDERSVRVPSIRGAMRFWFRALAATVTGPDPVLLSAVERQVFGDAKTPRRSTCILRIPDPAKAALRTQPIPDFLDGEYPNWVSYLLGQGLAKWNSEAHVHELNRPFMPPGTKFPLKIRFNHTSQTTQDQRHAIEALTYTALWLTSAYGGIGARTHRGFGGFEITAADGDVPRPWTPATFRSPAIDHYENLKHLAPTAEIADAAALIPTLLPAEHPAAAQPGSWPEFPILDRRYTLAGLSRDKCATLTQLLERTGYKLRGFRTSDSHARGPYRPERDASTPAWNHMRTGDLHEFPMSALGLEPGRRHALHHQHRRRRPLHRIPYVVPQATIKALAPPHSGAYGHLHRMAPLLLRLPAHPNHRRRRTPLPIQERHADRPAYGKTRRGRGTDPSLDQLPASQPQRKPERSPPAPEIIRPRDN